MNKLHRAKNSSIAGVCAGIAETFGVEVLIIRLAFLLSMFAGGTGLLLYLILWVILPVEESYMIEESGKKKLYRSRMNKVIGGVCSGLAKYLDWDISIIRLIFVFLVISAGTGVLFYIVLWAIIPLEPEAE